MENYDLAIVGAGAAGMMCAAVAGARGRRVVLIDHARHLAEKIRISGGGRCNFTNLHTRPECFLSGNPHFCRSALARYTPQNFIALLKSHRIGFHEKHRGQLFCDQGSQAIIDLLVAECAAAGVTWRRPCAVHSVDRGAAGFGLDTDAGRIEAPRLVVASGGLSIPKIGASDFGYRVARQFGIPVVEPRPALVPLTFDPLTWAPFAGLAGVSLEVRACAGEGRGRGEFLEDLLFTHRGLSGPAILQISSYWRPGETIRIDLAPGARLEALLPEGKGGDSRLLANALHDWLPRSLAAGWLAATAPDLAARRRADAPDRALRALGAGLHDWRLKPAGSEGYRKAEVTAGGVDTRALSSATLEAQSVPGLHFIGEVVDVTGWLGGYNFQWAWASAVAAGRAV